MIFLILLVLWFWNWTEKYFFLLKTFLFFKKHIVFYYVLNSCFFLFFSEIFCFLAIRKIEDTFLKFLKKFKIVLF